MRAHFKRVVKRHFRPLTERQQEHNAEDNARLQPLLGKTAPAAEKAPPVLETPTELRYHQLDELQRDWAIATGKLPEMVTRSMYGPIATLAMRGKGGQTIRIDMRTGGISWRHNWFVDGMGNTVHLGMLPMRGAELIEALRIAQE